MAYTARMARSTTMNISGARTRRPAGDAPADPTINDALDKLSTPQYKIGDLLVTVRELAAPWHACDGSAFSQPDYPELYDQLGGNTLPNVSYSDDTVTYIKMAND